MGTLRLILVALLAVLGKTYNAVHHKFGYKSGEQKLWREHSEVCAGNHQSPVHIVDHRTVALPLPALETVNYRDLLPLPICLTNTGHSVSLMSEAFGVGKAAAETVRPRVFGAALEGTYVLEGLHFHWGNRNSRGSEHVLSSVRFPLEMHIIHRKTQFQDIHEAMKHRDGLVVLAFFFQVRERRNAELRPLLRLFRKLQMPGDRTCLQRPFSLGSLLGASDLNHFYTYRGSLTTPPCSEAVVWILFPDPLYISYSQIKRFRRLKVHEELPMRQNYRFTQPLNDRIIYKRDPWKFNSDGNNYTKVNTLKWIDERP